MAFLPEGNVENKTKMEKVDYRIMKQQGFCLFSGENVINYGEIEQFVMELQDKYDVIIKTIGYDRYNAISSASKWEEAGLNTEEIKQHSSRLHPATKLLKEIILKQEFAYEMNQLFEINVANAREVYDNNLNTYVNKKKSNGKIDMLAAIINAMCLWNDEMLEGQSYLDQFGELPMLG
jgi:phage terminase large subunit-like protein